MNDTTTTEGTVVVVVVSQYSSIKTEMSNILQEEQTSSNKVSSVFHPSRLDTIDTNKDNNVCKIIFLFISPKQEARFMQHICSQSHYKLLLINDLVLYFQRMLPSKMFFLNISFFDIEILTVTMSACSIHSDTTMNYFYYSSVASLAHPAFVALPQKIDRAISQEEKILVQKLGIIYPAKAVSRILLRAASGVVF